MHYNIKIRTEALADIQEIVVWYEERRLGLGDNFKIIVSKRIDQLESSPYMYCIRYDNIRCIPLKKFPYMVHYSVTENTKEVQIFAVIHCHRNPEIWRSMVKRGNDDSEKMEI